MEFSKNQKHEIGKTFFNISLIIFAAVIIGRSFEEFSISIILAGIIGFCISFILGIIFSK